MAGKSEVKYAGIRFDIDGGADFVQNMQNIKHNMALTRQELAQLREQGKLSGTSTDGLIQKSKLLSTQYEDEKNRIQGLKTVYSDLANKYGENSKEAQRMAESVARSETSLKKIEVKLRENAIQLEKSRNQLYQNGEAWIKYGDKLQSVGKKVSDIGGKLSIGITAPVMAGMAYAIKSASDLESAMTGVEKTTDLTTQELKAMEMEFRSMSKEIPTTAAELAGVAEIAGQLGIEKENIVKFTRTIIDLGNATNLVGEEGAQQFARFANITKMSQDNFDKLGSTVVALGNNYATSEAEIVAMGMRLAAAGNQANMSEADIMALSTTLTSLGINAEAGGSAFSKVINKIGLEVEMGGKNLELISKISGESSERFKKHWQEDAVGALQAFIAGLGDTERMGMSTNQMLESLGYTELRMSDALRRASGNAELLTGAVELANRAWDENNALQKEATLRYSTSESKLEIQKNKLQDLAITIGQQLLPHVVNFAEGVTDLITGFTNLNPHTQGLILNIIAGVAAAGPLLKIGGKIIEGVGILTGGIGSLMKKLGEQQAVEAATKSVADMGVAMLDTSTKSKALVDGAGGITSAIMSPTGLVVGIGALILAFVALQNILGSQDAAVSKAVSNTEDLTTAYATLSNDAESTAFAAEALADSVVDLASKTNKTSGDHQLLSSQIAKLNELVPELGLSYDETTGKLSRSTDEIYSFIDAQKEMAIQTAFMDHLGDAYSKLGDTIVDISTKKVKLSSVKSAFDDLNKGIEKSGIEIREFYDALDTHGNLDDIIKKYPELKNEIMGLADAYELATGKTTNNFDMLTKLAYNYVQKETDNIQKLNEEKKKQEEHVSMVEEASRAQFEKTEVLKSDFAENEKRRADETKSNYDEVESRMAEHSAAIEQYLEEQRASFEDYQSTLEKTTQAHWSAIGNMESEGITQSDLTVEQARENLRQQLDDYIAYQETMRGLQERAHIIPVEMLAELEQQYGPQYTSFLQEMLNLSDEELQNMVDEWQELHSAVEKGAQESADRTYGITDEAFAKMNEKISERGLEITGKAGEIPADIYGKFEEQKGPIGDVGSEYMGSLQRGMDVSSGLPVWSARAVRGDIRRELSNVDSYDIGWSISSGVASGIRGGAYRAANAAADMAINALNAAKAALDSHSPSRKGMWLGKTLPEGVALGVRENINLVTEATQFMGNSAIKSLEDNLSYDQYNVDIYGRGDHVAQSPGNAVTMTFNFNGGTKDEYDMFKKFEEMILQNQTRIARGLS